MVVWDSDVTVTYAFYSECYFFNIFLVRLLLCCTEIENNCKIINIPKSEEDDWSHTEFDDISDKKNEARTVEDLKNIRGLFGK